MVLRGIHYGRPIYVRLGSNVKTQLYIIIFS